MKRFIPSSSRAQSFPEFIPLLQLNAMGNSNTVNKPKEYTTYPKGNALLTLSYIALIGIWAASSAVVIPVPVNLIVTSTLIIFIGCHRSLALLETGEDGKAVIERETLSTKDGIDMPKIIKYPSPFTPKINLK